MATTAIAQVYEPLTFNEMVDEAQVELDVFLASGIVVDEALITGQAAAGGRIGELPNFSPLGTDAPNISSDANDSFSVPLNIVGQKQIWRLASLNQSWSTMQLARELGLKDPLTAITNKVAKYWVTQNQKRVVQSCLGILADNVADDSGDMLVTIASDDAGAITAAELVSPEAVMDAQQTAGDHAEMFSSIAMHSVVYTNLRKQQVIDFIPPASTGVPIPYYLGMRVVVDDGLPAVAGTNRTTYTTVLFTPGAFGKGYGNELMPSELDRVASSGDGGGEDILHSREAVIYHPWGMSFISGSVAGDSATLAELADADNWDRVYERKNVGLAFLQTNG